MTVEVDPPSGDSPDGSGGATARWSALVESLWTAEPPLDPDAWLSLLASPPDQVTHMAAEPAAVPPTGQPDLRPVPLAGAGSSPTTVEAPAPPPHVDGDSDDPPFITVPFRPPPPPVLPSPLSGVPAPPPPILLTSPLGGVPAPLPPSLHPSPADDRPPAAASVVPKSPPPPATPVVGDFPPPLGSPDGQGTPPLERARSFLLLQRLPARQQLTLALAALGAVALVVGFLIFERAGTAAFEHSAQRQLAAEWARSGPTTAPPASLAALLTAPRLGLHGTVVVEGATLGHLHDGPAQETTAGRPGQPGAVVILGHHSAYGSPFARLNSLRRGDEITLRTTAGTFLYKVSRTSQLLGSGGLDTLTLPSAAEVQTAGGKGQHADQDLVLATGSGWSASHLSVVVATLGQSSAVTVQTPGSRVANVRVRAVPGQPSGVIWAGLWLAVIALAVYWAARSWSRLPPAVGYTLASVVVLLAVYQLFLAVDRVLPGSV